MCCVQSQATAERVAALLSCLHNVSDFTSRAKSRRGAVCGGGGQGEREEKRGEERDKSGRDRVSVRNRDGCARKLACVVWFVGMWLCVVCGCGVCVLCVSVCVRTSEESLLNEAVVESRCPYVACFGLERGREKERKRV